MHTASKSLKKAHQDLDVDKIADLMDDIQEQQDVSTYSGLYQSVYDVLMMIMFDIGYIVGWLAYT